MSAADFGQSVFVNCPFDPQYTPIFDAIVFAVYHAGFRARCAWELADGAENRLDKISRMIAECQYGIYDISRTAASTIDGELLPRFNMPLELGLFIGCKKYGNRIQKTKSCLILDRDESRYRNFIYDIAGQDIEPHHDDPGAAIKKVCRWLSTVTGMATLPGGQITVKRYGQFKRQLPRFYRAVHKRPTDISFVDYSFAIATWIDLNPL